MLGVPSKLGVIGVYAGTVGRTYANDAPAASKADVLQGYNETLWGKEGQIARNRCLCPAVRRPC
jgi:hypothetical protein